MRASGVPLSSVRLRQPVPRPRKVLACLGNYKEFTERARAPQDMFMQSPESVIGLGDTVTLPPHDAAVYQHEAELVIVIGKRASSLTPLQARSAIFGYTVGCDVSGRGLGKVGTNSRVGKAQPGFKPIGPWIVTTDEIADPHELGIRLSVSDEPRQVYTTDDMEYRVPEVGVVRQRLHHAPSGRHHILRHESPGVRPSPGWRSRTHRDRWDRAARVRRRGSPEATWTRVIDEEMAARARDAFAAPRDWSTFKR